MQPGYDWPSVGLNVKLNYPHCKNNPRRSHYLHSFGKNTEPFFVLNNFTERCCEYYAGALSCCSGYQALTKATLLQCRRRSSTLDLRRSLKDISFLTQFSIANILHRLAVHDPEAVAFPHKLVTALTFPNHIRHITAEKKANLIALLSVRRCKANIAVTSKEKMS
jgi:hypothetical protein